MTATTTPTPVGVGTDAGVTREFARFGTLFRLGLRRERIIAPVTIALFVIIDLSTARAITAMYGTTGQRADLQLGPGSNAAFRFLLGELDHLEPTAALVSWRAGLFLIAALGVCAALMTVRQTRKEEELGRTELIRAGAVGGLAPAAAAVCVAAGFTVIVSLAMSLILVPMGAGPADVAAVFAQYAATGFAAIAVALVAAQIATTSHIANLAASSVVLVGYLLRGAADATDGWGWLRWSNPIGWAEEIDPFGADNLLPALLSLAVFVFGLVVAGWVAVRRDLGAGLIAPRAGPAESAGLTSIEALGVRLSRPLLISWMGGLFVYSLIVGFMQPSVEDLTKGNQQFDQILRAALGDATLSTLFGMTMMGFLAVASSAWGVNLAERLRAEETGARTEVLLATPTSRTRYYRTYVAIAAGGAVILMVTVGLGMVIGSGVAGGGWSTPAVNAVQTGAAQLPAILVVVTLALALYAIRPVLAHVGWIVVVVSLFLGPLSGMFDLPQWVDDLSPFTHSPLVPVESMNWTPVVVMLCVSAVFATVGWVSFRRRQIG